MIRAALAILFFLSAPAAFGQQIQVSPTSVNAYSQGATSALLTFRNVKDKQPVEGCWCAEVVPAAPEIGQRCAPATQFGCLPVRYNQSALSANSTYTDIMSIPPAVARRAYVDAASGAEAVFYYVRRFVSTTGGPDEFVPVAIRLAGNGAATPFSLTNVKLAFALKKPVLFLRADEKVPKIEAEITYTGSGRLTGRWEIVKPGDELPTDRDLLTESTLPGEERDSQRRYQQLGRFNTFLPPTGKFILPGPESWRLQNPVEGMYLVLLRIEAVEDQNSLVESGAVAGFPLPVLRYYVGGGGISALDVEAGGLRLILPEENAVLSKRRVAEFIWTDLAGASFYRIEFADAKFSPLFSAVLLPGMTRYRAPASLFEKVLPAPAEAPTAWRVVALDRSVRVIAETGWRSLRLTN